MRFIYTILFSTTFLFSSTIDTSYKQTFDYKFMSDLIINTNFNINETNGDIQNLRELLKNDHITLAVSQKDILSDLAKKNPNITKKIKIITPFYDEIVAIISNKGSDINSFRDLNGRTIATDIKGSGDYYTFLKLQEKIPINVEILNMKKNEFAYNLKNGNVDAIFYIGDKNFLRQFKDYNIFSPNNGLPKKNINLDKNTTIKLSYIKKFILTTPKKEKKIDKNELLTLLGNLIKKDKKICNYDLSKEPFLSSNILYIACSKNINKLVNSNIKVPKLKIKKVKKLNYFNDIHDIKIYMKALNDESFNSYGTSYQVEKMKLKNAINLIKKRFKADPNIRIVIISKGKEKDNIENLTKIYRLLKRNGIRRDKIVKRSNNIECSNDCFLKTVITFDVL